MMELLEGFGESVAAAQLIAEACFGSTPCLCLGKVQRGKRAEAYAAVPACIPQVGDEGRILWVQTHDGSLPRPLLKEGRVISEQRTEIK